MGDKKDRAERTVRHQNGDKYPPRSFRHYIGSTYVALQEDEIVGYATVSIGHLEVEKLPKKMTKRLPTYPLPVLRLARLAIAKDSQGRGVGRHLLKQMVRLALQLRTDVGCVGIVVDAKPGAESFYQKFGFVPFHAERGDLASRPKPAPMFLSTSGL